MNTDIKAVGTTLTPAITSYVTKRLEKIDHVLRDEGSMQCDVELKRTTNHHNKGDVFKADIHIVGHKQDIFASSEKSDLYAAIDDAVDEAFHSVTSRRKKYMAMARRGGARVKNMIKGLWPNRS